MLNRHIFFWMCIGSALLGVAHRAYAEPFCPPTTAIRTIHYPGAASIPPTNNLVLPTGKSVEPEVQKLTITGRVLDSRCRPVPEAVVELWQRDAYGKWGVASNASRATPYPVFAGAGRAITDGDGEFTFITAFPGVETLKIKKDLYVPQAPKLYVRINPAYEADFSTVLFFDNDHRNETDALYSKLQYAQRRSLLIGLIPTADGNLAGSVQLVLPGQARYRTY